MANFRKQAKKQCTHEEDQKLWLSRKVLADADEAQQRIPSAVYAAQFMHLQKEFQRTEAVEDGNDTTKDNDSDGTMAALRAQVEESRARLSERRRVSEGVDVRVLKEQIERTREQLIFSASVTTSLTAWQRRAHEASMKPKAAHA